MYSGGDRQQMNSCLTQAVYELGGGSLMSQKAGLKPGEIKFGRNSVWLYKPAVETYTSISKKGDKVCSKGYHVATQSDIKLAKNYLGVLNYFVGISTLKQAIGLNNNLMLGVKDGVNTDTIKSDYLSKGKLYLYRTDLTHSDNDMIAKSISEYKPGILCVKDTK